MTKYFYSGRPYAVIIKKLKCTTGIKRRYVRACMLDLLDDGDKENGTAED